VKGKVEETLPGAIPEKISILRLDTDWYESTYHELVHLYPLLTVNGFLIVDDYGYWKGAREAVDKYFEENGVKIFMNRLDNSARGGIKTA
jgi:predicted kinase